MQSAACVRAFQRLHKVINPLLVHNPALRGQTWLRKLYIGHLLSVFVTSPCHLSNLSFRFLTFPSNLCLLSSLHAAFRPDLIINILSLCYKIYTV